MASVVLAVGAFPDDDRYVSSDTTTGARTYRIESDLRPRHLRGSSTPGKQIAAIPAFIAKSFSTSERLLEPAREGVARWGSNAAAVECVLAGATE